MMNKENVQKVLDLIEANPSCWNQEKWHCGTTHCFAGHAQILSGKQENVKTVRTDARIYLDLSLADADWAFYFLRTLEELKTLINHAGYNRYGYNHAGYNRNFN